MRRVFIGETIGTFILVFIGCSSVAVNVLFGWLNLYSIASIWAIAVALGIYSSKKYCDSHLNPAVTLGFTILGDSKGKHLIGIVIGQFFGAFLAAGTLYLIFGSQIESYEKEQLIIRGYELSKKSSMMFGEYYPNPGNPNLTELSTSMAMVLEGLGTFLLFIGILIMVSIKKLPNVALPILIGIWVGILIVFIAPYTQCGINPARDFGPRIFSYLAGWKPVSFSLPHGGAILVYVVAPLLGSALAAFLYKLLIYRKP